MDKNCPTCFDPSGLISNINPQNNAFFNGPCSDGRKDCPPQFPHGSDTWIDPCTGEVRKALPLIDAKVKDEYDLVAVKLIPKKKENCELPRQPCQQRKCCKPETRTRCYTCQPRREDCYPADPRCYSLEYLDAFDQFKPGQGVDDHWTYFTNGDDGFIADDGSYKLSAKEGLTLVTSKFKKTWPSKKHKNKDCSPVSKSKDGILDHIKTLLFLNSDFDVPDCGELYVEACVSAAIHNVKKHPFGSAVLNHESDLRLGYSALVLMDPDSGLFLQVALTNDSIYAIYEIFPGEKEGGKNSGRASFAVAHLIGRRNVLNPISDYVKVGLAIDKRKGAKWYINNVLVWSFNRLGYLGAPEHVLYQIPGEQRAIDPTCVNVGFGHFTMLDAVCPENHKDLDAAGKALVKLTNFDYRHPWHSDYKVKFADDENRLEHRLFGQGATLKIKEIKVERRC